MIIKHLSKAVRKEVDNHLFDYLLFFTFGSIFLLLLNLSKGEKINEYLLYVSFVFFYIIWGIYHHIIEKTLHLKAVVEYIIVGFTILFLLKILIIP